MGKDSWMWIIGGLAVIGGLYFFVLRPTAQNAVARLQSPEGKQLFNKLGTELKSGQINIGQSQQEAVKFALGMNARPCGCSGL